MWVVNNRKIFFALSGLLVAASIAMLVIFGLQLGIEFTGGSVVEIEYQEQVPDKVALEESLAEVIDGRFQLQQAGESGYLLRAPFLDESTRGMVTSILSPADTAAEIVRESSVGPSIGNELRNKALVAIVIVIIAIILFVAYAFRKVSEPVSSWKYGLVAIMTLIHDVLIPVGLFALLGVLAGAEVGVLFVMALLAILGYSVNDTIVVFDRIRENLRLNQENNVVESFDEIVGRSLEQTYTRSINTSVTTLLVLLALLFIGPDSTTYFAITLIAGVVSGTYSSIFLASPMLVKIAEGSTED